MRYHQIKYILLAFCCQILTVSLIAQNKAFLEFDFNKNLSSGNYDFFGTGYDFVDGLDGQALRLTPRNGFSTLNISDLPLTGNNDFTIQCWIKTSSEDPTVFLSQKHFDNKSINAQKNPGWVLYSSGGTFAWSVGSGERRINYEVENGGMAPVNNGAWHQYTISYNKDLSEFRLYYDGQNKAVYKVNFEFDNTEPLTIGAKDNNFDYKKNYSTGILEGQKNLQAFVDEFNKLGLSPLKENEFLDLIVEPEKLLQKKQESLPDSEKNDKEVLSQFLEFRKSLLSNAYTVFQNMALTKLKPVSKIFRLQDGIIIINKKEAETYTQSERLFPSDFLIDNLSIWKEALSDEEVLKTYNYHKKLKLKSLPKNLDNLTVGVWNIWHGGIHWTIEKDGWDSRMRIVEMVKEKNIDVLLMQETYSSGDFIASELGYYFATTSDWDYRYQGANISVLSRFLIKEILVSPETEFNNVAVKLSLSETQEIWAMSNWYGMQQFPAVCEFHKSRFDNSDNIPVLFGGDFNAVPHTDGGDSPASNKMMDEGFTDAFRSLYNDSEEYPGFTHRSGTRIDQLYFKGRGLKLKSTKVISSWPGGFPSDHYLIVSKFELNY